MELTPEQASRLADLMWDSSAEAAPVAGRLALGTFGRYHLLRLIGVGGMGEVYEAEQESPRRRVALKVIRTELLSPEAAARFDNEARILARLQHPGIAQIYEAGRAVSQGVTLPYFAMEFIDGQSLIDFMRATNPPLPQRLRLFMAVCEAVEHAHRKGVIHRDLKPGNILVDASGQPRVLDFGIARVTESDLYATTMRTEAGHLVGTLPYMSPEQISTDPEGLDTRSDVYTLGVLLYELLTGRLPYAIDKGRLHEAARIIRETDPAPLSTAERRLPDDVQTIVSKALAKERERRYQSVAELSADIRRYLNDEPIEARPSSAIYQLRKLARRHRAAFMALLASAVTLAAGASVAVWFAWKEAKANTVAQKSLAEARSQREAAEEMTAFLQDLLAEPSAARGGRDARVVDLLNRATARLDNKPPPTPSAEAALRDSLGLAYLDLGQYAGAEKHLTKAVALNTTALGADNPRTLEVREHFLALLVETGRYQEAEKVYRELVATYLAQHAEARKICRAMQGLATSLHHQSRLQESLDVMHDAHERAVAALGPNDRLTLMLQSGIASSLKQLGRYEESVAILEPTLAACEQFVARDDVLTIDIMNTLASDKLYLGAIDEAVAIYRDLIGRATPRMGATNRYVLTLRANLANAMIHAKRFSEAETEYSQILADAQPTLGAKAEIVINLRAALARCLGWQGRFEECVPMMLSVCADAEEVFPPTSIKLAQFRLECGAALMDVGRLEEGEAWLQRAYQTLYPTLGNAHTLTQDAIGRLARVYDLLGNKDKAEEFRAQLVGKPAPPQP